MLECPERFHGIIVDHGSEQNVKLELTCSY